MKINLNINKILKLILNMILKKTRINNFRMNNKSLPLHLTNYKINILINKNLKKHKKKIINKKLQGLNLIYKKKFKKQIIKQMKASSLLLYLNLLNNYS